MNPLLDFLVKHSRWCDANRLSQLQYPAEIFTWMNDTGSLTQRIVEASDNQFSLKLIKQSRAKPLFHEQKQLRQDPKLCAVIREVELSANAQAVVLARSIIPLALMQQHHSGLTELGTKPLGHLLFTDGKLRISRRQFTSLKTAHGWVYARRTPYDYLGSSILVAEYFLPAISSLA